MSESSIFDSAAMAAALLAAALVALLCSVSYATDAGPGSAVYASNGVVVVEGLSPRSVPALEPHPFSPF